MSDVNNTYDQPYTFTEMFESGMMRQIPEFVTPVAGAFKLNLGAGFKKLYGATSIGPEEEGPRKWFAGDPLPYGDESVGAIYAYHLLEHLGPGEVVLALRECERVLTPNAPLNVIVPHYLSEGAHYDIDHRTTWTESSFDKLFKNPYYDKGDSSLRQWKFRININMIMGLCVRNLVVMTQLVKTREPQ